MNTNSKILIIGSSGLIGSEILKLLMAKGFKTLSHPTSKKLNLLNYKKSLLFLKKLKPDIIFNFAAKVGGIKSNDTNSFDFIIENTLMSSNLLQICKIIKPKLIIQPAPACFYPKSQIKIKEKEFLNGKIEETI